MFLFLNFKNELHAAASMSNEASRPDLDFMSPEYALRGNDADVIQVSFILLNLNFIKREFANWNEHD